ncbi:hypothetical protein EV424DRAFT_1343546 [Suillus variegatus]|nr:hypothetical protein EV424DRAFT_1343546 [Suillus variegatus]
MNIETLLPMLANFCLLFLLSSTGRASKRFEDWLLMLIQGLVTNTGLKKIQGLVPNTGNFQSTGRASKRFKNWFLTLIQGLVPNAVLIFLQYKRVYQAISNKIEAARSYCKKYYAKQEDLTSAKAALADIIGGMEGIQQRLRLLYEIVLQAMGTGEELQRVDLISHHASSLILALEDLLMHVMVDPCDALEGHTCVIPHWSKMLLLEPHIGRCQFDSSTLTLVFQVRLSMCDPLWVDITTTPYMAEPEESVTVYKGSAEFDEAVYAMADECFIFSYRGIFYNMPAKHDLEPPFYCVTYGRYIGVFPSYLW